MCLDRQAKAREACCAAGNMGGGRLCVFLCVFASIIQVLMFSATLHSPEVKRLAAAICQQPMLVDLKGRDAVPDTVDHVLLRVDPTADATWLQSTPKVRTGGNVLGGGGKGQRHRGGVGGGLPSSCWCRGYTKKNSTRSTRVCW